MTRSKIAQRILEDTPKHIRDEVRMYGVKQVASNLWLKLLLYSDRYQINYQMWPNQHTIYVEKDGVELFSFGTDEPIETMTEVLKYLNRITKNPNP